MRTTIGFLGLGASLLVAGCATAPSGPAMSDSLFDLAVAMTSLKDWLKEHPGASFSPAQVEKYVGDSTPLNTFRDVANGGKHRIIRNYEPQTMNVTTSAVSSFLVAVAGDAREPPWRRSEVLAAEARL